MDEDARARIKFQLGGPMAGDEEKAESARVATAKKSAATDRAREEARRAVHKEAVKRAQAESIIVHGPVR